jgi:2-dehydro-3-deoxygluconokinase
MQLRNNATWAMVVPTSMGVRLTPDYGQPVHSSHRFTMEVTSAETNVASISSFLGLPVKVLTAFVEDSPIAAFIKNDLAARHMAYEGPEVPPGSAWGYRHQFNIADSGLGSRGPLVHNDRAGEVGRTLNAKDFDLDRIFGEEGAQILHLSGVVAALSPDASQFCLEVARAAKRHGTRISFDLNYRASFWAGREGELRDVFAEIAGVADILIGNEEDFQLALGAQGPAAGGDEVASKIDGFKDMIGRVKDAYPNASYFTSPSPVRSVCSTASAVATASSAACSTASSAVGSPRSACSSAGPPAPSLPRCSRTTRSLRTRRRSGASGRATRASSADSRVDGRVSG